MFTGSVAIIWDFKYLMAAAWWKMFKLDLQELGIRREIRAKEPWFYKNLVVRRFDVSSTCSRKEWLYQTSFETWWDGWGAIVQILVCKMKTRED